MKFSLTSLQQISRKSVIVFQGIAIASLIFSGVFAANLDTFANPRSQINLIADVPDINPSQHPSGNDRNTENGQSGTQGKSTSNPDGNGADKRYDSRDGAKAGTQGSGDYDGNNGCGNDNDFADDNNGNCGGKPKPIHSPKPTPTPKPSGSPKPSPKPSPRPCYACGGGSITTNITNNSTNNNTNNNDNTNNNNINVTNTSSSNANVKIPSILPETGAGAVAVAAMGGIAPLGFVLAKFRKGKLYKDEKNLEEFVNGIFKDRTDSLS